MTLIRSALLAASESDWLRRRAPQFPFVRRAVTRFMPGEDLASAIGAAARLNARGFGTILTHLGENITVRGDAEAVVTHYLEVLDRIERDRLDTEISVKLTQLGLDLDVDFCYANLDTLIRRAHRFDSVVTIDMESTRYTDTTLALFRRAREQSPNVMVAIQAYLYRTRDDIDRLLPLGPAVRLVKGAYREPPDVAFPKKAAVDANYLTLASTLLAARPRGAHGAFATHDPKMLRTIQQRASETGLPPRGVEFQLLYGIRTDEQDRLLAAGHRVRVLIAYGSSWFPWYMRRLAERPANLWFVVKNLVPRI
jgi:proline dehydrogenase